MYMINFLVDECFLVNALVHGSITSRFKMHIEGQFWLF